MRVLVIEDDAVVAQSLELMLKTAGFGVEVTDLGEDGLDLAKLYDFDAITLDLSLPDIAGFDVLRRLRSCKIKTPVMILTASAAIEDKVRALDAGADDYMTKPAHMDEIVSRLRALVRRSKGQAESVITTGNLTINLNTKTATIAGVPIHLTGKEYQMLELLSLRKGATLSKEAFLTHLYQGRDEPELKIIDVFVCKIRKKLKAVDGHPIETVWGRGYKLREEAGTGSASMSAEVSDFADAPPVHVSKMSFAEYDAMKDGMKGPGRRGRRTQAAAGAR